jgi:hypothetical protein
MGRTAVMSLAMLAAACTSAHGLDPLDGATPVDGHVPPDAGVLPDAWTSSDDMGPAAACDLTGTWSGTRTDVSLGGPRATDVALALTQRGGTLVIVPPGTGTIVGHDVDMMTGSLDFSGNWYTGAVDDACTTITGEWRAYEMAHGPFTLTRH